jgi:hypothetical protein
MGMFKVIKIACLAGCAALIAACGSSTQTSAVASSTARGTLAVNPPFRIASLDAASFTAQLAGSSTGAQLLQLTGNPVCGVDFYKLEFWTIGGAGESTESSGALMVPTGGTGCSGARPIVEYAHGTQAEKTYDIADITNTSNTEGVLIAAAFAAQGYIVVAPNYAGYDISTLGYHPYLDAVQNSSEMIDILAAARTALPNTLSKATSDSGQLFLTGYSEGGYVAVATQRAMQAAGTTITAVAGLSGPYALEAFGDTIFFGGVDLGSTEFTPLLTTSYQHAYGNIYTATTDVYSAQYANGIDTLLPSTQPLGTLNSEGLLPATAEFDITTPVVSIPGEPVLSAELTAALAVPSNPSNPDTALFDLGFGNPGLVTNAYRVSYAEDAATNPDGAAPTPQAGVPLAATPPTQTLRKAFYANDLRNGSWAPKEPTLLCGGDLDPTVYFSVNTQTMQAFWAATPAAPYVTVVDVNATPTATNDPFAPLQAAFLASGEALLAYYESPAGGSLSATAAEEEIAASYHVDVAPFCVAAAASFFSKF